MSQAPDSILVVAFKFPPYEAVGGKRWAKLSKYLARGGTTVHVLTVPWPGTSGSAMRDVSDPRIRIHRIPSMTPNRLRVADPLSTLDRIRNRLYRDRVGGKPWAQDAALWGPVVIPAVVWLARRQRVQTIIVTGAPFMAGYWIAKAKPLLPDVPLIQEFRDPWADLPDSSLAGQGGKVRVESMERRIIDSADAIVTVTKGLSELIRAKSGDTPVYTVTNGFDPDDMPPKTSPHPRPFRLIHGGNLYVGREEPLQAFLDSVMELQHEMPDLELIFRGGFPQELQGRYTQLIESGMLRILPAIDGAAFMKEVEDSFVTLQFNARQFPYALSTKIFEYGASGRPVLSLNYGGEIAELIDKHELGWTLDAADPHDIREGLRKVRDEWLHNPTVSRVPKNFEQYSYARVAADYLEAVTSLSLQRRMTKHP